MPSVSKKQHNFMAAVAKNPKFAKKAGVSQNVGKDFLNADKGKKFERGGEMKEPKKMMAKEVAFMKKKGAPKSMIKHEEAEAGMKKGGMAKYARGGGVEIKGKTKGAMVKMAMGGACMKKAGRGR
jgi:hypothetical protein